MEPFLLFFVEGLLVGGLDLFDHDASDGRKEGDEDEGLDGDGLRTPVEFLHFRKWGGNV